MMSMKGDGKPVSFIEDCAVPLEHLAEYTDRLTRVFEKHGTRGTWYAHASVGCLHVRPLLDMRTAEGARRMRAIAEEACALVKEYKGSYSGEHGDGLVRSEWIEPILRFAASARVRRDQTRVRPEGPDESGQDRRAYEDGRPRAVPLQARLPHRAARVGPRLVRARGRRRRTAAAASRRPWRCATTTATAASSMRARCARRTA